MTMNLNFDPARLTAGLQVVGPAGEEIGEVKEVRTHDFQLNRTMKRDVYVPFRYVREIAGSTLTLDIRRDEIDDMGWEMTPLFGGPTESDTVPGQTERVAGIGDPAERGSWASGSDSYDLEALDTEQALLATEGIDDGAQPRAQDRLPGGGSATTARTPSGSSSGSGSGSGSTLSETDRLRDMMA